MAIEPLNVLVWAAYPALRAGIAELVRGAGLAPYELGAVAMLSEGATDVDILVADVGDEEAAYEIASIARPLELPVLFMAADDLRPPSTAIDAGYGWVSRATAAPDLAAALRAVAAGFVVLDPGVVGLTPATDGAGAPVSETGPLTPREIEVLEWLALGLPNKAIALKLGISEHTVKFHVGSVLSKLEAGSRTEAVTTAARRGLLAL